MNYKRTIEEFDKLSLFQKTCTLWIYGSLVHHMESDDSVLEIYSLGDFFVEVVISRPEKKIQKINSFLMNEPKSLAQYFSAIQYPTNFNFQCN